MKKRFTLFSGLLLIAGINLAQVTKRSCASHTVHQQKMLSDNNYAKRIASYQTLSNPESGKKTLAETVYTIPVVVHVVHNGENIGVGQNISEAQINSAITALNKDFRKLNTDTLVPSHPFYSLQADIGIEFCLASKDPSGNSTNGINRINGGQAAWTVDNFDANVKPTSAWDRTKYMNIWITTFSAPDDQTLGYATFPGTNDASDGVVIAYSFFGTIGNVSPGFDLNRTATHEVGHYLNLSHIWGDATCGDDFVSDTPTQEQDNSGCPSFPHNVGSSCNPGTNGEMFMNYMDYVDDACMSLFTTGQKDRMRAALLGPRASLTTSDGCSSVTSTKNLNLNQVSVFPNPANNIVNVVASETIETVTIYSISGKLITTLKGNNSTQFNFDSNSIDQGNYFIAIETENGIYTKKLVVIK